MADKLQQIDASIQDQSLQRLHQMKCESHRPEADDVCSARRIGHRSQPSPLIFLLSSSLLSGRKALVQLQEGFNKVSLSTHPPSLFALLVEKCQINASVTSRIWSFTSGSPN